MSMALIPRFSNIYPNEVIPSIEDLLKGTPSRLTLGIMSFINGATYLNTSFKTQYLFLSKLIERLPQEEIKKILFQIDDFKVKNNTQDIVIFPLYTTLKLIQWEICNYRDIKFNKSTPDQEHNIFKAVLIFNEMLDNEHKALKSFEGGIYEIFWPAYQLKQGLWLQDTGS